METNQEKRGIVKKACNFLGKHIGEIVVGSVGLIAGACMLKSTKNTIETQNDITNIQKEEHEKRMELYEKAKYSDNTSVNINL